MLVCACVCAADSSLGLEKFGNDVTVVCMHVYDVTIVCTHVYVFVVISPFVLV